MIKINSKLGILFIILIAIIIISFIFFRFTIGHSVEKEGACFFELDNKTFLPPRSQILRGCFEHVLGKIYIKLVVCSNIKNCDGTIVYYFWLNHAEIKDKFGKSLDQMEKEKKHPFVKIKIKPFLNGDYKIISIEKIKWVKGMPYSYN